MGFFSLFKLLDVSGGVTIWKPTLCLLSFLVKKKREVLGVVFAVGLCWSFRRFFCYLWMRCKPLQSSKAHAIGVAEIADVGQVLSLSGMSV